MVKEKNGSLLKAAGITGGFFVIGSLFQFEAVAYEREKTADYPVPVQGQERRCP